MLLFTSKSEAQSREYMLKAGILEKIARYSEWPPEVKTDTFKINVIGRSPFNGELENLFTKIEVKNKPVSIEYISSIQEINDCHILFISDSESKRVQSIVDKVRSKPVLTVGETRGYINKGVMINFFETPEGTLHFEISKKTAKSSQVKMDIKLLNYAKLVD